MKKLLSIATVILVAIFCITPISAADTHISSITIDCTINDDGSAVFTEVWDMHVYRGTEVYKTFKNMYQKKLTLLSVSESGHQYTNIGNWNTNANKADKANKSGIHTISGGYELCFGIGEYGHKVYTMKYSISNFINQYKDYQGINYAFMGNMSLDVYKVTVDIHASTSINNKNSKIWGYGYEGRCDYLDNGHIHMTTIGKISKVQLLARLDEGHYTQTDITYKYKEFEQVSDEAKKGSSYDKKDNDSFLNYIYLALILPIIALLISIISKFGFFSSIKVKEVFTDGSTFDERNVHPFRDLPTKDLFYFYYLADMAGLINDSNKSGILSAYLLKWIRNGYVHFEKGEKEGFIFKHDTYTIDFTKNFPTDDNLENTLKNYFIQASGSNHILETKEFEKWAKDNYTKVHSFFSRIISETKDRLRTNHLLKVTRSKEKKGIRKINYTNYIYDMYVKEDLEHVYGLYLFLIDENNMKEKETIEVHLWDEYLMFAAILGIADRVQDQLKIVCPEYEQMNYDYYQSSIISRAFIYNAVMSSDRAYRTANSSSASSGGGGFSSFGGGGGGFSGGGGGGVR